LHLAGGRSWAAEGKTGGWRDHTDTDHHFVLSGLNGKWEKAAPCPSKRNSTAGGIIEGQLQIVGGRQVGGGNLDAHTVYDHKADRWHKLAPMPKAQGGLAAASLGGKLYAFGGEFFDNGGGVYRSIIQRVIIGTPYPICPTLVTDWARSRSTAPSMS